MPSPQPQVLKAIEETLGQRVEGLAQDFRREVEARVTTLLPTGELSLPSLARAMSISTSTLARRLAEEGTTCGEIVDQTRRRLAFGYLRAGRLSMSEIAFLLGFAFVPAFNKSFRRWTGTTPSAYREGRGM
jgi:AraC-like DNA-binding protein